MRLLTHPVVVCNATHPATTTTTTDGQPQPQPTPRAMTMSSFTSLALAPAPVVSFNIAVPSRTYDAVAASRRFNIHVLADDASGARVADWFAGGNAEGREVFERLVEAGGVDRVIGFEDGGGGGGEEEAPVLEGEGVLYVLRCRLLEDEPSRGLVRVRDHVIVLGEVLEIVEGLGAQRETEERFGLLYADRRYRQLGGCITPGGDGKG
jgi:flavin reductase (DIM6/NTAB) family NADH-FMN oxidoreductase RutF